MGHIHAPTHMGGIHIPFVILIRSKHGVLNPHEDPSHIYKTRPKPMDCGQPLLKKQ